MSCGVDSSHGSDPVLLWLWCRLAATAPICPLAWEPPYAMGAGLKSKKKKRKQAKKRNDKEEPRKIRKIHLQREKSQLKH